MKEFIPNGKVLFRHLKDDAKEKIGYCGWGEETQQWIGMLMRSDPVVVAADVDGAEVYVDFGGADVALFCSKDHLEAMINFLKTLKGEQ